MKRLDLVGQRFGKLRVISYAGKRRWLCRCDCGEQSHPVTCSLRSGATRSCGCSQTSYTPDVDIVGRRFGKLLVLKYAGRSKWLCRCDCGATSTPGTWNLHRGVVHSCGCLQRTHRILPGDEGSFRARYRQCQGNAVSRGYEFSLTVEQFRGISAQSCFYCGAEPQPYIAGKRAIQRVPYLCNGLDRQDNQGGYTKDNCVACCAVCNYMKRTLSVGEFLTAAAHIIAHQTKKTLCVIGDK